MRAVRSRDTAPEMIVRRAATALGYRYRLHRTELPGKPDLVFGPRRKVVFVHGCFWHGHDCKRGAREPKANADYWRSKVGRNRDRDAKTVHALAGAGWQVLIVWECETRDETLLAHRLNQFLDPGAGSTD
jgi:DNA mismatch endonuclease (patch repair protein)